MTKGDKKNRVKIDPDLEDIIPRFLEIRQENIAAIATALDSDNFEAVVRIGHSMKGAGAGYGFDYITDIGKTIEDCAKMKDGAKIKTCVNELSDYLNNIDIVYGE